MASPFYFGELGDIFALWLAVGLFLVVGGVLATGRVGWEVDAASRTVTRCWGLPLFTFLQPSAQLGSVPGGAGAPGEPRFAQNPQHRLSGYSYRYLLPAVGTGGGG